MKLSTKKRLGLLVSLLVLIPLAIFSAGPLIWTFMTSLKDPKITFQIPPAVFFKPTLTSYLQLFSHDKYSLGLDFVNTTLNSLMVATVSTLVTLMVSCLAAYSLSRFKFKGSVLVGFIILCIRMLPPIAAIIPLFIMAFNLGLMDTTFSLVIAYTAINIPFSVWMLRGFMQDIPIELDEAARIDGCSRTRVLWYIILPVITPGLSATSVFTFLLTWNDLPIGLALSIKDARTLPVIMVSFSTDQGVSWGPLAAAATLMAVPAVIFVATAQRYIVKGLTMGAVKG